MHELGIIININKTLEEVAAENHVTKISSVTLELGEVSGIVPDFLTDCWNYYRRKSLLLTDAKLIIEPLDAVTLCESCGEAYSTVSHGKQCPHCGSFATHLLTGNQCNIKEIEVYEPSVSDTALN